MKLPVKVLGMCGSLRSQSTNLFLAEYKRRAPRRRRRAAPAQVGSQVYTDKQELLVQQLEALKELSLKLNPHGSNPEL